MGGPAPAPKPPARPKGVPANALITYESGGRGAKTIKNWSVKNGDGTISVWSPTGVFQGKQNIPKITPSGGGGGGKGGPLAAITDAVSSVGNAVSSAVTSVGKTVDAIIQNPLPMIETAALIYVGVPPAVASAAVSAMNGGNISDVATAAVTAYAGGQIASAVGGSAGSTIAAATEPTAGAYIPSATTSTLVKVASSAIGADVAATTIALSQGKDLTAALEVGTKAAVSSVISSAASGVGSTVASKVDNATAAQILANAAAGGTTAALTGKDIAAGAATAGTLSAAEQGIKSALDTGADALKSITKSTPPPAPTPAPVEQVAATPSGGTTAEDLTKLAQESAKLIGPAEPPTASLDTGVVSDAGSPAPVDATINIPPSPVAGLDITQDQSQAETERLARLNQQATTPAVVEPTQGAYLPEPTRDQQILDLIAEKPTATEAVSPSPIPVPEVAPVPTPTPITEPEPVPTPVPEPEPVPEPVPEPEPAPSPVLEPETTPPTVVEPVPLAPPPISERDREILNLISPEPVTPEPVEEPVTAVEPPVEVDADIPRVEVSGVGNIEPPQGAYLPDTVPAESTPIEPAPVAEGYSTSMPDESAAETARLAAKEQQILDLITPAPVVTEPAQGAYLPDAAPTFDTVPEVSPELIPAPVAELYDSTMPDQLQAETERLARQEQEILNLISPTPVAEEPKQGAFLPDTAPTPADIPAADPMSKDPAQLAAEAADVPAVEVAPSTGTGLIDTPPVSDTDKQILDLISEEPTEDQSDAETERLARKEAELAGAEKGAYLPDSDTETVADTTTGTTPSTNTYKPTIFSVTDLSPRKRTAAAPTSALGSALGTTGLTSYRGAGEIEGTGSGKPRKKVWTKSL